MDSIIWQAWDDGGGGVLFAAANRCAELQSQSLLTKEVVLLHQVAARTGEEAMMQHHEKMGFEPYLPVGPPRACPNGCCGSIYPTRIVEM